MCLKITQALNRSNGSSIEEMTGHQDIVGRTQLEEEEDLVEVGEVQDEVGGEEVIEVGGWKEELIEAGEWGGTITEEGE